MNSDKHLLQEFQELEDRFNIAMISNDPDQIAQFITRDWALVTPQSGPLNRDIILGIIKNGVLTHATMTKQVTRVRRYGDVAVVTGRNQNTGTYQGKFMQADEWVTDVFVRSSEGWRCSITHTTPIIESTE